MTVNLEAHIDTIGPYPRVSVKFQRAAGKRKCACGGLAKGVPPTWWGGGSG
eukprot:COSAG01_NODE_59866_length_297_cov_6.707071_1_plen_50_part_01